LAESRANPTSCAARLLERIAPLHARSGGVKAGGVQTAAAESYRLYLPHWNRFRKPPPDRAAEKGSVAEHFPMRKFPATRRLRGGRAVASCRQEAQSHDRTATDSAARRSAALRQAEGRSLVRACAALVLGNKPGVHPEQIIKTWGDDAMAAAILKVAQSPTSTATYPQLQATAVLPMLAPAKSRTVDDRPMR